MIHTTEQLTLGAPKTDRKSGPVADRKVRSGRGTHRHHHAMVRAVDWNFYVELCHRYCAPIPTYQPSEWLETAGIYLQIDATRGKSHADKLFSFTGREYLRELIDQCEDPDILFQSFCAGTGIGKTLRDYGIIIYELYHNAFSGLYVMPALTGSGSAAEISHEIISTLEASPVFESKLPKGHHARKESLTRFKIEFDGNHVAFVGGQSTSKLGGKRCRLVFIGEQDKTKEKLGPEEGADYLAAERTKGMADSKIFRGSSPSIEGRAIWKALMGNGDNSGSDCRRRFLPCPHCNQTASGLNGGASVPESRSENPVNPVNSVSSLKGWFVLIKDAQYNTALPTKLPDGTPIPFAELRWDKEAKRKDGSWDMDRVIRSTRFECPHCGGHITDKHRLWLDKNGLWIPTRKGEIGHAGYQLSSFYAPLVTDQFGEAGFKSTWGGMAQKFLNAIESGTIGGYINSDLAEVNASQDKSDTTTIEISTGNNGPCASNVYWTELSSDRQAKYPGFWYRVRRWCLSVLRPPRTPEQEAEFFKQLTGDQKTALETLRGPLMKSDALYTPEKIVAQITRTDHWPKIADWLIANSITGPRLNEFFQVEFQTDLIRMLEFIAKQPAVNVPLGRAGDSELIEFGSADSWEEIDDVQRRHRIANPDVIMDARFGSMDNAEVFAECFRRCPPAGFCHYSPIITPFGPRGRFSKTPMPGYRPFAEWGWTPVLGYPEHKVWPGKDKIRLPYTQEVNDPFVGKMEARQFYQYVFKFDAQWALSELARIRKKYAFTIAHDCKFYGHTADMRPVTIAEYNLHMKGYYWDEKEQRWEAPGKQGGSQSRRHPNHLYDCEKNGAARAVWKGIFRYQRDAGLNQQPQGTK